MSSGTDGTDKLYIVSTEGDLGADDGFAAYLIVDRMHKHFETHLDARYLFNVKDRRVRVLPDEQVRFITPTSSKPDLVLERQNTGTYDINRDEDLFNRTIKTHSRVNLPPVMSSSKRK